MSADFQELERLIAEKSGATICPICGTPFAPYNSRQKTCGTDECKRAWKNKYLCEYRKRLQEEDREAYRAYNNAAHRKSRLKQRKLGKLDKHLEVVQERYERMEERDKKVFADGINYGKRQMERTLAMIPKIDVNLDRSKENDDVHDKDEQV